MILGLGLDMVKIQRLARCCEREAFVLRVFTAAEQAYVASRPARAAEAYAGMFAAKEAVAKALLSGFDGFGPRDIEVLHGSSGRPEIRLSAGAAERLAALGGKRMHLTIAHDGGMAAAAAIVED